MLYFCPTRRRPVALSGGAWQSELTPRAMTDYAGNAGTSYTDDGDAVGGGTFAAGDGNDGVVCERINALGRFASVTSSDLTDGASNTIMVGEKNLNSMFFTTECEPDDNAGYVGGYQDDVARWGGCGTMDNNGNFTGPLFPPAMDRPGGTENFASIAATGRNFWFGSSHTGGAQFVFCDGSVTMIHYSVDPDVSAAPAAATTV